MSLRSFLLVGVMACSAACGGEDMVASAMLAPNDQAPTTSLVIQDSAGIDVVAGTTQALRVRYVGLPNQQPLADAVVEFGLTGAADGASLQSALATTDAHGFAEMTLVAGGTVAAFRVRASAEGATPVYFDVNVVAAQRPALTIDVTYDGQRPIETRSVSILDNMKCEQFAQRNNSADVKVAYMVAAPEQSIDYKEQLGAGRTYAVVAWGSDATNSKLATGCVAFTAPVTDDADQAAVTLTVPLHDLKLDLAARYAVSLTLDAHAALAALSTRSRSIVDAQLPQSATPQASFLLDLLPSQNDFATARKDLGLDAALEASLTQTKTGPLRAAEAWASLVADEGGACTIEGQLTSVDMGAGGFSFAVDRVLSIRSGTVAKEIDLSAVPLRGAVGLSAAYSAARAAIDVQALKVPIGFGSYAVYLLNQVQASPDVQGRALADIAGCAELSRFVDARTAVFGAVSAQVAGLCSAAVQKLRQQVAEDWTSLDSSRAAFQVGGSVFVHDRDGEGSVDDLGPAVLSGDWATSGASSDTKVNGILRVTPKATLTI